MPVTINLKHLFASIADTKNLVAACPVIVSDVFGTLIKNNGDLHEDLQRLLLWAQGNGIAVRLASSDQRRAHAALSSLDCAQPLLGAGVSEKFSLYESYHRAGTSVIGFDDQPTLIRTAVMIDPTATGVLDYLRNEEYKRAPL